MAESSVERKILNKNYEDELCQKLEDEIKEAGKVKAEKVTITELSKLNEIEKFDVYSIYYVFNRKQKTESFVNGKQAEVLISYTDDYIIKFSHRTVEV